MENKTNTTIEQQVEKIVKQHDGTNKSPAVQKEISGEISETGRKISDLFHSAKSLKSAKNNFLSLARFAQANFGINELKSIDIKVIKEWTIGKDITYKAASTNLCDINKIYKHLNITKEEIKILRKELKSKLKKRKKVTRAYKNLEKVKFTSEIIQTAFLLQRDYGVRVSAAININIENQIKSDTKLTYKKPGGKEVIITVSKKIIESIIRNAKDGIFRVSIQEYSYHLKKQIKKMKQEYNGSDGVIYSFVINKLEQGYSKREVADLLGSELPFG